MHVTIEPNDGSVALPNGAALEIRSVRASDGTFELRVTHPIARAAHLWVPHLTPEPHNVIGDWVFRSPAIIVADETIAIALVVDIDDVARANGFRAWLDYDHPRRTITLGSGNYRHEGHVFFAREPASGPVAPIRLHALASTRAEDLMNPYGLAARFCWERWGRSVYQGTKPPPIASHLERIVRWAFSKEGWGESVWQDVELGGVQAGAPVFIVDVGRHPSVPIEQRTWREPKSIWNQAWFSTQRCANGLHRYARQVRSEDLAARARKMTELALAAPRSNGLFPSVLRAEDGGSWRWTNSDRRPASATERACHIVDAAFTGRQLDEWTALTGDARGASYVDAFVERLLALQRPSGAFPGWVEPDGAIPHELAEGPESAMSIALLLERADRGDAHTVEAAARGLSYLESVTKEGRWEDFETYYSCAPWKPDNQIGIEVARNGVYKQNTLSIAWCAEAFMLGARVLHEPRFLALARRCIDELSLYQAVWSPPFLPAPGHGGFGVLNADSEWNDARQSLFAPLFLELGAELGDRDLVERGVSALRASFSMLYCPENAALARAYERRFPFFGPESYGFMMENQGHDPAQPIGTFTIYTWGNGSALAAVASVRDRFPEIAEEHVLT